MGNIGNIKTLSFWINPKTTTEQIMEGAANDKLIHINSGTLTYPEFDDAYIDGVNTNTLVANKWQFVTIVSTTDVDFSAMTIGLNNATYGDMRLGRKRAFTGQLTLAEHTQIYTSEKFYYNN